MSFADLLQEAGADCGLTFTTDQLAMFTRYFELLVDWNGRMNLTAITEPREVAVKHFVDSLACWDEPLLAPGSTLVDVGTGAGFPGLPLKIIRPDLELTLLDSLNKRLTFLQEVVAQLGLTGVRLIHARAEDAGRQKEHRGRYRIAVSRAVARLAVLSELCLPFVAPDGWFLAWKGSHYQEELQEAAKAVELLGGRVDKVQPVALSGVSGDRAIIVVHKIRATPDRYPRRAGLPEKKPL